MQSTTSQFWKRYLLACGEGADDKPEPVIDTFGDNPLLADELTQLILRGRKTASCAMLLEYEKAGDPVPSVGDRKLVVDGREEPVCVIETTAVKIIPYREVDAGFAYDEGEDDQTYESWDREHRKYFKRILEPDQIAFSDEMLLVCERFKVVYREGSGLNEPGVEG